MEITGELMPYTWANFATALELDYVAYVAEKYPHSAWSFHAHGPASNVAVNATRFAAFVAAAWDGPPPGAAPRAEARTPRYS